MKLLIVQPIAPIASWHLKVTALDLLSTTIDVEKAAELEYEEAREVAKRYIREGDFARVVVAYGIGMQLVVTWDHASHEMVLR